MVDHVPADAVLAGGGGGGCGGRGLAPAVALVAHPADGAPARVVVAAVSGALQLPVEHQLVEGGPASRHLVRPRDRRIGIQKAVSELASISDWYLILSYHLLKPPLSILHWKTGSRLHIRKIDLLSGLTLYPGY